MTRAKSSCRYQGAGKALRCGTRGAEVVSMASGGQEAETEVFGVETYSRREGQ